MEETKTRAYERADRAVELFCGGYNCAQSVLLAFAEETGLDTDTAARLASSFGGGMGRLREVCGAVSGMFMAAGLCFGSDDSASKEARGAQYARVQALAQRFREQNGSIICRELLAGVPVTPGTAPEARSAAYYKKRPCAQYVAAAAVFMQEMLEEAGK